MLERLRERRRELLEQHDLGGVYDDIAEALRDVVRTERSALDDLDASAAQARAGGDDRRADLTEATAATKNAQLDVMPPDLAGQFKALDSYDFESDEARRQFAELAERLREQLMQQFLDQMAGAVDDAADGEGSASEELQRLKDMLAELNAMLAQRARGEEPDFEGFMERYGDFFPENPKTLDELLEVMARRMAAAQSLLNSMTPAQRDQLQQLSEQLLADMDLNWQVSELAQHLRNEFGDLGWDRRYDFSGVDPLDLGQAADMLAELGDIDQLENLLRGSPSPGALAEARHRGRPQAAGRRRGREPRAHGRGGPHAGGGRPDREPRGALRPDPPGHPQDRPGRPAGPLRPARRGQARPPRHRPLRPRPRAGARHQALRPTATRSTCTSAAPSATRSPGPAAACRCGCIPTTSRWSGPSSRSAQPPC